MRIALASWVVALTAASAAAPAAAQPRLSGRVLDFNGSVVPFADLDFYDTVSGAKVDPTPPGAPSQSDKTDLSGRYSLLVKPDLYDVRFQPPPARTDLATIFVRGVVMDADRTIDVTLPLGHALTGFVRDGGGAGVANVDLDVTNESTGERVPTPNDQTGASGAYRVVIEPGTYTVSFAPNPQTRLVPAERRGVVVAGPTALDVVLDSGYLVTGAVLDSLGAALAGADLDVDDAVSGSRLRTPNDRTAADGGFAFVLPAGVYDLSFDAPPGFALASAIRRGVLVAADLALPPVTLTAGVEVRASVIGPDGFPLEGGKVVVRESPSGLRYPTPDALSDALGLLVLRVPAGAYDFRLAPPAGLELDSLALDTVTIARDTTIVFRYGETEPLEITLRATAEGGPTGGRVDVWRSPREGDPVAGGAFDATGAALLALPPGLYDLLIHPGDGFAPESLFVEGVALASDSTLAFEFERISPPPDPGPGAIVLGTPRPNPFVAAMRLPVSAPAGTRAEIGVFDTSGRLVREAIFVAGSEDGEFVWDGRDARGEPAPAGVYAIRVAAGGSAAIVKTVLLR